MTYEPTFDSLGGIRIPDWIRDAKFGIWSHWGPQSVPMCGDWYARNMYVEGTPQYLYHLRHYGHPSEFGYKDICALWRAENFDPDALMARYHRAGARYFVAQAMHHDHFFNFPSRYNRMNSVNVGPKKDIVGLWKAAAEKYGMPFGLTEHFSASFSWWRVNKGADKSDPFAGVPYDGNDPAWRDFYFDNFEHGTDNPRASRPWFTDNEKFHAEWRAVMTELIDRYQPDLLYTDGSLPFGEHWEGMETRPDTANPAYASGLEVVARLYNTSMRVHGENRAIYTQKDAREAVYRVGMLDVERGRLSGIAERPWQTDTCIGGWFYDAKQPYKTPGYIVGALVDIISKNGALLLNILQKPDGTIDSEAGFILDELADWFRVCAEGVYETRPWRVYGEGATSAAGACFHEDETDWRADDIRFTRKGNTLYAFLMAAPESRVAVVKSLTQGERVGNVRLLGAGNVEFSQSFGVVTAKLPENLPAKYVNCLALELEKD